MDGDARGGVPGGPFGSLSVEAEIDGAARRHLQPDLLDVGEDPSGHRILRILFLAGHFGVAKLDPESLRGAQGSQLPVSQGLIGQVVPRIDSNWA